MSYTWGIPAYLSTSSLQSFANKHNNIEIHTQTVIDKKNQTLL